ncbi:unnamed protein product [Phyllotreta striolata]|uniref:Uncharacterized protein n=1 Tax=Phyllotreta striolata TaxID=444603 RepID=A0A9N9TDX7_PHYSR|nr:unnamed protein product [Phyllotreta striolata]
MKFVFLLFSAVIALASARVHLIKLRDVDLAGTLTGGLETDPITFSVNGYPVTLGGAGQGDLTGAVKVHTPKSKTILTGPIPSPAAARSGFDIIEIVPESRKMKWDWLGTPFW